MSELKNYDPNISYGTHLIKITFQQWAFKSYVTIKKSGNTKGMMILSIDIDDLYDSTFVENKAKLEIVRQDFFKMILANESGEELEVEDWWDDLGDLIVSVEILTFENE